MDGVPAPKKERLQEPCSQELPHNKVKGDGVDRISCLPDAIQGDIISLLPTKDGARTRVLDSQWCKIWSTAPLSIDYRDLIEDPTNDEALVDLICNIVKDHKGPARRLCIPARLLDSNNKDTIDTLLWSPTLNGLQELEFHIPELVFTWSPFPPPPPSFFRLSSTFHVAFISGCHLPDSMADQLQFPILKQLTLFDATISEGTLHAMLAGCLALEILLLKYNEGFRCIRITSPCLKSIGFCSHSYRLGPALEEVIIEDAPCLQRLIGFEEFSGMRISVVSAPKLETMGCISECSLKTTLTLGSMSFQSRAAGDKNWWRRKHKNLIKTLDLRLKSILMTNYHGVKGQTEFAKFFVMNASVLESMRFLVRNEDHLTKEWIEKQHRQLKLDNRASRDAQFTFTSYKCRHKLIHVLQANDLSIADPFDCSC